MTIVVRVVKCLGGQGQVWPTRNMAPNLRTCKHMYRGSSWSATMSGTRYHRVRAGKEQKLVYASQAHQPFGWRQFFRIYVIQNQQELPCLSSKFNPRGEGGYVRACPEFPPKISSCAAVCIWLRNVCGLATCIAQNWEIP